MKFAYFWLVVYALLVGARAFAGIVKDQEINSAQQHAQIVEQFKESPQLQEYLLKKAISEQPQSIFNFSCIPESKIIKIQITKNVITLYLRSSAVIEQLLLLQGKTRFPHIHAVHTVHRSDWEHIGLHLHQDETELTHVHLAYNDSIKISASFLGEYAAALAAGELLDDAEVQSLLEEYQDFLDSPKE